MNVGYSMIWLQLTCALVKCQRHPLESYQEKKKYLFKNYQRQLFAFNNYLYSTGQTNKLISIFTFWGVEPSIQRVVHIDKLVSYYLYMHMCVCVYIFFFLIIFFLHQAKGNGPEKSNGYWIQRAMVIVTICTCQRYLLYILKMIKYSLLPLTIMCILLVRLIIS